MKTYKIIDKEYKRIAAFEENGLEWGTTSITFEKLLKSEYAEYVPATLMVPAELSPEVSENAMGEKLLFFFGGATARVKVNNGRPYIILPFGEIGNKPNGEKCWEDEICWLSYTLAKED